MTAASSPGASDALLESEYVPETFDPRLTAVLLERVALAHPSEEPGSLVAWASTLARTVGHLAGAADFCGGIDTVVHIGEYEMRVFFPSSKYTM